jgi:hypothetical protein
VQQRELICAANRAEDNPAAKLIPETINSAEVEVQTLSIWENILLTALAILIIFWFRPGIKASLARSRAAEKDWPALLVPLVAVVLFVVFLIMMV